jgi:hypothetical protein
MRPASIAETIAPARLLATPTVPISIAAVGGLAVGAALVSKPQLVVLVIALALAAIGVVVAFSHPAAAFVGLVLMTALIPSYAAPSVGPLLFIPAAAASWVLAVALGWRNLLQRGRLFRPTVVDLGVGAFVLLMAISTSFSPRGTHTEFLHVMFLWAGPYLGCRLLLADVKRPMWLLAASFGLATATLAPFALFEYLGGSNLFHNLNFNAGEFATWAGQADRFGQVRVETSFGHPIALSMFVATSALLSLGMALNTEARRERNLWYASAALALAIQILTVSRTGWLILLIGIVALVLIYARGANRRRLVTLVTSVGVALLLASVVVPSALQVLPGFEKSESSVTNSSDYRQALLTRALEPGVLNAWGNAQNKVTPFVAIGSATDNAYIILADSWGLIPTAALIFIALALLWLVVRWYSRDPEALLTIPVAAFAGLVALFFVAFITQQQVVIWLLLGASGVAAERLSGARKKTRPQPEDRPQPREVLARM